MSVPVLKNEHISNIKCGDLVEHAGKIVTVGNNHIKYCDFMGYTLFGDSYALGNRPVKKVVKLTN